MAATAESILKSITDKIRASVNVETLYGESRQIGNKTIIPVAQIKYGFGAGGGEGHGAPEEADGGSGSGGGGGGGADVSPVGYIVVDDYGTEFVRIRRWPRALITGLIGLLLGILLAKLLK